MPSPFEPLAVQAHGLALHARERNPSGSPAVVFLHGWLDHTHGFDWLVEHLPDSWRLVLFDLRGMGRSAWQPGVSTYPWQEHLVDLEAVLRAARLESAHLVGHSLGGIIATAYAAARPARVKSLSLIDSLGPLAGPPENAPKRLGTFLDDQERAPNRKRYPDVATAAARLRENNPSLSEAASLHFARHGTEPVGSEGSGGGLVFTFDPLHRRRSAQGFDDAQWLAVCAAVTCPVQLLLGTDGLPMDEARARARIEALRLARPLQRIPGGHHVHMDAPEAVARALVDFIPS